MPPEGAGQQCIVRRAVARRFVDRPEFACASIDVRLSSQVAQEPPHVVVGPDPNERHPVGLQREDETQAQAHPRLPDSAGVQLADAEALAQMGSTDGPAAGPASLRRGGCADRLTSPAASRWKRSGERDLHQASEPDRLRAAPDRRRRAGGVAHASLRDMRSAASGVSKARLASVTELACEPSPEPLRLRIGQPRRKLQLLGRDRYERGDVLASRA